MTDKCREAFQNFMRLCHYGKEDFRRDESGRYQADWMQRYWDVWRHSWLASTADQGARDMAWGAWLQKAKEKSE